MKYIPKKLHSVWDAFGSVSKRQLECGLSFEIDGIIKNRPKNFFKLLNFHLVFLFCVLEYRRFQNKGERTTHFQRKYLMASPCDLDMYLFPKSYFWQYKSLNGTEDHTESCNEPETRVPIQRQTRLLQLKTNLKRCRLYLSISGLSDYTQHRCTNPVAEVKDTQQAFRFNSNETPWNSHEGRSTSHSNFYWSSINCIQVGEMKKKGCRAEHPCQFETPNPVTSHLTAMYCASFSQTIGLLLI